MGARRAFWAWGLLAVGIVAIAVSLGGHWYVVEADLPENPGSRFMNQQQAEGIDDPRQQYHTTLWTEVHWMLEGADGGTRDHESAPFIAQVLAVTQTFFVIGLVGLSIATVGLLFRARGVVDGKGIIASIALVALLFLAFGVTYFAVAVPDAYDRQLTEDRGVSPELGFYTFGTETEEGVWQNVFSGPGLGWYAALVGVLSIAGAFGMVYAPDLQRARDVFTDDAAAARQYAVATDQRRHVMERIRGGNGE